MQLVGLTMGSGAVAAAATELVSGSSPFGWLGSIMLAGMGALTLWHSGALRAWKETAEARDQRIGDLEAELQELRSELAIPERIEGVVRLMAESAERADKRAGERVELLLERMDRLISDRIERGFGELSRVVRESSPR